MEQYLNKIEQIFNSGDPEVKTWFLIRHNYLPFILCGFYALFSTVIGPAIMRNRKPMELRKPMIIFNFFIVATYTITLAIIFWNLPKISREQFCLGGTQVKQGDLTYLLTRSCWVIYLLKYVEFFDTVFFVLRKKENLITFLHVMHHTVVPILGWIMFRTEKSGFQSIPVLLNASVHVIMYSYYGLAAMGPQVRKYLWWKKYLTQLQMIQFALMIIFVTIITPLSGCTMVLSSFLMDIAFAPLFLYLFYKFYKSNFQPAHEIANALGPEKCSALPMFHALTGCDSVSSSVGHSKVTAWSIWNSMPEFTKALLNLTCTPSSISEETMSAIKRFTISLCDRISTSTDINKTRKKSFSRTSLVQRIPPTLDALKQHVKRAIYHGATSGSRH